MKLEEFKTEILENPNEPVRDHILDFITKFFTGNIEIPDNKKEIPEWVKKMEESSGVCLTDISTKFRLTTVNEKELELTYTINLKKSDEMRLTVIDLDNFSTLEFRVLEKKDYDEVEEGEMIISTDKKDHYFSFSGKYTEPLQMSEVNENGARNTLINFLQYGAEDNY